MNRQEKTKNWYDQTDLSAWYSQTLPAPESPRPRKKRTGLKVTMIVLCVLILVAATALAFSGSFVGSDEPAGQPSLSQPGSSSAVPTPGLDEDGTPSTDTDVHDPSEFFGGEYPGEGFTDSDGDGFPDDYRDFFDSFYTMAEESLPSNLKQIAGRDGLTVTLESSAGLDRLSYSELYAKCSASVVGIMAMYEGVDGYGWGSGVVLTSDGYIITNSHVISEADTATVVLSNGLEYNALLVGEDTQSDIAVLKIEAKGLTPATFGNSDELWVGDGVVAIGNPLGIDFSGTLTDGIISAINRSVDYNGVAMTLLQTNAAINEGNSGGPLFNMYGQVIGITNMKMVNSSAVTIEGIGFAIPSTTVKEIADQLIAKGKVTGRPGIGITVGAVPEAAAEHYGLASGLYITAVVEGCDAQKQGIKPGDILTHINGQPVATTDDVLVIRDQHQPGDVLTFTIFRNGESFDVDVELYDQNDFN